MRRPALFLLAVVASMLVLYRPGLIHLPVLDDHLHVMPWLSEGARPPMPSLSEVMQRPLSHASFAASARLSPNSLAGWKGFNLVLHLAGGLLVAGLVRALAHAAGWRDARAPWLASAVAAAWLLHPLQPSTVLYTVQRMTQLSALFCFAGLWAYVAGRLRQRAGGSGGGALATIAFLCTPFAVLGKENGALLPLYLFIVEALFFRGWRPWLGFAYAAIAGAAVAAAAVLGLLDPAGLAEEAAGRGFTLGERLLTELRVLVLYAGQILAPSLGRMGFYHDDLVLSTGLLSPPTTLLSMAFLGALLVLGWALRGRAPLASFGIFLFFCGHLLESTLLPLEPMFEHRNYLPMLGLLLAAAVAVATLPGAAWRGAITAAALAACAVLTAQHVQAWSGADALYAYIGRAHPDSPRLRADLAELRTRERRYDEALALLQDLPSAGARLQAAYVQCRRDGTLPPAVLPTVAAALASPLDYYPLTGLVEVGAEGLDGRCRFDHREYLRLLEQAASLRQRDPRGRYKLRMWAAHFHWALAERDAALSAVEEAAALAPADPVPLFLATEWSLERGDRGRARGYFARAVSAAEATGADWSEFTQRIAPRLDAAPR